MNPSPVVADTAPPAEDCDAVLRVADDLTVARQRVAELEARYADLKAELATLKRRVANQRAVIESLRRAGMTARRDAGAQLLLDRIERDLVGAATPDPASGSEPVDEPEAPHACGADCHSPSASVKPIRGGLWRERFLPLPRTRWPR